ncbi:MAG: threonine synthase, partial [Deltaproteobacteria bacterium]|nr:threonine synthase [Deltaproteobacteria bacterium]
VSMPRVIEMVEQYNQTGGKQKIFVVEVTEQAIIDHMLLANRNGHIACTQGGESLAGLVKALAEKKVSPKERAVLNATAHSLKFSGFQEMYFNNTFPPDFGIHPKKRLQNYPVSLKSIKQDQISAPMKIQSPKEYQKFVEKTALKVVGLLGM